MPAIITKKGRTHSSEQFLEAFDEASSVKAYVFIGKASPWDNEFAPDVPADNEDEMRKAWLDMIGGKQIDASNISNTVRRINWESGKIYDRYDDKDENLFDTKDFYVITDQFNVYKCIDNNGGAQSTVKPTGTGTSILETGDGYKWKYLYTVSSAETEEFVTEDWIPVKFLTSDDSSNQWDVQNNTVDGGIHAARVTNTGAGYTTAPSVTIEGDGSGATAEAIMNAGEISHINITDPGSGYTRATITISGGTPTSAGSAEVIYSPPQGHGANPLEELGGFLTMLSVTLSEDESGVLPVTNDFRKIGILIDPYDFGTTTITTNTTFDQSTKFVLTSVTGTPEADDTVTGDTSGATAKVIRYESGTTTVHVNEFEGNFQAGEGLTFSGSGATATLDSITDPDLEPRSGNMIFLDHRQAISRSANQSEKIKTIFEF